MKFGKKVKTSLRKESDSERVYNEEYLTAKLKSYNGKIKTSTHDNKKAKQSSQFIYLLVFLIGSVFRTGINYYPRVLPKIKNRHYRNLF